MKDIEKIFKTAFPSKEVAVFDKIDSTNKFLKENTGFDVALALEQDGGRGRLGRSFSSEKGGIYFSFKANPNSYRLATVAAAVAVCKALEERFDINPSIKWVNDIIVNGKKLCGILAESNLPEYLVIGIGINATNTLPQELSNIATTLAQVGVGNLEADEYAIIPTEIIRWFESLILLDDKILILEYKKRINYFEKEIEVIQGGKTRRCIAKDVDLNGNLIVEEMNGNTSVLSSAEISTKI